MRDQNRANNVDPERGYEAVEEEDASYSDNSSQGSVQNDNPNRNTCCGDSRQMKCRHAISGVLIAIMVGFGVGVFCVKDDGSRNTLSGFIFMFFILLIINLCCNTSGKKIHSNTTHITNNITHNNNGGVGRNWRRPRRGGRNKGRRIAPEVYSENA